jgi:tetratricopeptide (TPR) repeat protein
MRYILALAILLAAPAHAESPYRLYADGKYDEAVKAGVAANDAVGFGVAARAALAEEATRDQRCLKCLERAEGLARRTIAADPRFPDGHIYLAISLGLQERIRGPIVAKLKGYPEEAKAALDAALAVNPRDHFALAALGGWNIAIVRRGGAVLAGLFYGATLEKGQNYYAAAVNAAPASILVRYQYALMLAEYDADRFHDKIAETLTHAVNGSPDTVYDRLLQKRAGELLALLKSGDRAAFAARVRKYQGYP